MSFIKDILKRALPVPFLKDAFLTYNKIKILTVDRILYPEFKIAPEEFIINRKGYPFRESGISIDDLLIGKVRGYMQSWYDWTQEEFLLVFNKNCIVEPEYGWAIVNSNRLLYYSLGVSRTWFQRKPSIFKLLGTKETQAIQKAISLRDTGEENYFHFYNDVLGKLFFLQQNGIAIKNIPIIVSKKTWSKEYFRYFLENSSLLQSLNWIVQDKQYIQCESVIFCKPLTHRIDLWKLVTSLVVINKNSSGENKVFITRAKARLRFIENSIEIETIATRLGFLVIDTDQLSMAEQIQLFSSTRYLIGIHGAGLTNLVYQNGSCKVLELFPPPDQGYLPYHYILLAKMFGFQYSAMIGQPGKEKYSGGFYLPPDEFENQLLKFFI